MNESLNEVIMNESLNEVIMNEGMNDLELLLLWRALLHLKWNRIDKKHKLYNFKDHGLANISSNSQFLLGETRLKHNRHNYTWNTMLPTAFPELYNFKDYVQDSE